MINLSTQEVDDLLSMTYSIKKEFEKFNIFAMVLNIRALYIKLEALKEDSINNSLNERQNPTR